jgi:hypothetical protein
MCKMKNCARPSFVGGLCGYHALEGWSEKRHHDRRRDVAPPVLPAIRSALTRRRAAPRPASG